MNIIINDDLRRTIDPLTPKEFAALERSLLTDGCRDALVLWGEVLIDGHNRYAICRQHGIAFNTVQHASFGSMDDVVVWMIDNHLARRSVSDFQRGVLALRKKEIVAARAQPPQDNNTTAAASQQPADAPIATRDDVARLAGISSNTVIQIEKIQKTAAPELVEAVRAGTISINAAATVASLPVAEQTAAVAGGKKELQQLAKRVRESKRVVREDSVDDIPTAPADHAALTMRIGELTAENATLLATIATLNAALEDARRGV
jgi:hypothetical protein